MQHRPHRLHGEARIWVLGLEVPLPVAAAILPAAAVGGYLYTRGWPLALWVGLTGGVAVAGAWLLYRGERGISNLAGLLHALAYGLRPRRIPWRPRPGLEEEGEERIYLRRQW